MWSPGLENKTARARALGKKFKGSHEHSKGNVNFMAEYKNEMTYFSG